ncbi:MAG: DUF2914 domain-containing protein [bacterium]|nr:DUF2914 domain-containing protein [bacterium]
MGPKENEYAAQRRVAFVICLSLATMLAPAAALPQEEIPVAEDVDVIVEPSVPSALGQFTTAVENREPVDQVSFVENDVRTIIFFSDLRQLDGRTVTHRWLHGDVVRAEVAFEVRGPRWRVWSSKDLLEDWLGDWTVEIVLDDGEVIAAETFTYTDAGR